MATRTNAEAGALGATLVTDQQRAETLLSELATELCRVPVERRTCALHLRALALKRHVMRWPEEHPDESVRRAVVDEVIAMQRETREWRQIAVSRRLGGTQHGGLD